MTQPKLNPHTPLRRAGDLEIRIDSNQMTHVSVAGRTVTVGPHGLAILQAFARPMSYTAVVDELAASNGGVQDWISLTADIHKLYQAGILRPADQPDAPPVDTGNYDAPLIHIAMLNDRVRTERYLAAIREVVRPGDVVVDIGTGTGILAIGAAQAGARQVYAVEASGIADTAEAMFAANGVANRVTLVRGWSTQITLPERADVLVSEMIGNEPLGERLLEVTSDATKRLLRPDARLIPEALQIYGLPVVLPDAELIKRGLVAPLDEWESRYDMHFTPFAQFMEQVRTFFTLLPQRARDWRPLSEPVLLADIDLRHINRFTIDNHAMTTTIESGLLNGVLIYFETQLSPSQALSTHPAQADAANHWRSYVWLVSPPLRVEPGESIMLRYQYNQPGAQFRVNVARTEM